MGASTPISTFSAWLVKTLEYLDNDYSPEDTKVENTIETKVKTQELKSDNTEEGKVKEDKTEPNTSLERKTQQEDKSEGEENS